MRGFKDCPKQGGILDKSIYTRLRSNEFVALLRVNVLWRFVFSEPFRWLAGKTAKLEGWSLFKMCVVLKLVEDLMIEIIANPARLLDPALDPFAPVARELLAFAEWREEQLKVVAHADDGTEYFINVWRCCARRGRRLARATDWRPA